MLTLPQAERLGSVERTAFFGTVFEGMLRAGGRISNRLADFRPGLMRPGGAHTWAAWRYTSCTRVCADRTTLLMIVCAATDY